MEQLSCQSGSCATPLRGGVRIEGGHETETICTAGFIARAHYVESPYLITAGHCLIGGANKIGQNWAAKPVALGETEAQTANSEHYVTIGKAHSTIAGNLHENASASSYGDMGLIEIIPTAFWGFPLEGLVIKYGNSELVEPARNEEYPIYGTRANAQTTPRSEFIVCMSGVGGPRGVLAPNQEADCGAELGFTSAKGALNLELVNTCTPKKHATNMMPGSSGGPVYKAHYAYGTIVDGGGCYIAFQDIDATESTLHVHIETY
jgi:hypothetical protein